MKISLLQCLLGLFLTLGLVACEKRGESAHYVKSDFKTSEKRYWIGPEYWSNPLQDWQVENGELLCLVSKENRNVHLLTTKLDSIEGDLKMQVDLRLFSTDTTAQTNNWVGFSIGAKGEFNDYRDDAVFGKGLKAGITTKGHLFIDEIPEKNERDPEIQDHLLTGVSLKLVLEQGISFSQLTLSLLDENADEVISQLSKNIPSIPKLAGDLVLVSHFSNKKSSPEANEKSVAFQNWTASGNKLTKHPEYNFGPILFSQYTLSKGTLKMTTQMAPVILNGEKVQLQIRKKNTWTTIQESGIDEDARTATFKIAHWDSTKDTPYRLVYRMDRGPGEKENSYWEGTIRKDPTDKDEVVVAGFTGNSDLGFPNADIFNQVKSQDPDVLFFSGDQIYEPVGGYGVQREPFAKATLDYLRKWYMYGWAYRDLMKDRPTVSIPDDHDVYHGNIWGAGGRPTPPGLQGADAQDAGGYKMPARWVNMVQETQTSHLPDPFDPSPVEQGIGIYYTDMVYGGISFAIIEDRKFKSPPKEFLPEAQIWNGWALNEAFDAAKKGDAPGAVLLGERQLKFLEQWVADWGHGAQMKVLLSQTLFSNVATLPEEAMTGSVIPKLRILEPGEYPPNDRPVADMDSNGWPQSGRNRALKILRKGFAFHLAGDQHLGSTIQYGVDEWNDAGFAFCVPSISNFWPRRWYPYAEGLNRAADKPRYTGEYEDGFGNKMTVHAVSNPIFTGVKPSKLYDRAAGFGIVRLNKNNREITIECRPRKPMPDAGIADQYEGWPVTVGQLDNYGRKAAGYLPEIQVEGLANPVIQIIHEQSGEMV